MNSFHVSINLLIDGKNVPLYIQYVSPQLLLYMNDNLVWGNFYDRFKRITDSIILSEIAFFSIFYKKYVYCTWKEKCKHFSTLNKFMDSQSGTPSQFKLHEAPYVEQIFG